MFPLPADLLRVGVGLVPVARETARVDRHQWEELKIEVLEKIDAEEFCRQHLGGVKMERGEVAALCPFHDESHPSLFVNAARKVFYCQGCGQKGSLIDLHMQVQGLPFRDSLLRLADELGIDAENPAPTRILPAARTPSDSRPPPISPRKVDFWHNELRQKQEKQTCLIKDRGLKRKTLAQYKIGWDGQRYTIPVYDDKGDIVNIRRYDPQKRTSGKMLNYVETVDGKVRRYGSPARLYGLDELKKSNGRTRQIVVCEGEWDRLLLCQHGHLAVTGTHGAKTWRKEWTPLFTGENVVLLFDTDRQGRAAAKQVAEALLPVAAAVRDIALPLKDLDRHKDVTDWYVAEGRSNEELIRIITKTQPLKIDAVDDGDLDFVLHRMTTYGSVPKRYLLDITPCQRERGVMEIDCDTLMRPGKFERAFAEHFNRLPCGMPGRASAWREIVNKWLDESTVLTMPEEASDRGALKEYLLEQLEKMAVGDAASDLDRGMAVDTPAGKRVFRAPSLFRQVALEFGDLGRSAVYSALRQLGCEAENVRVGDTRLRVWSIPADITTGKARQDLFADEDVIESGLSPERQHLN